MNCVSILKLLFKHKSLQTVFRTKHVSLFGNRYEKSEMEKKKETHQQRSKIPQAVMQHNRGNTNALFSKKFPMLFWSLAGMASQMTLLTNQKRRWIVRSLSAYEETKKSCKKQSSAPCTYPWWSKHFVQHGNSCFIIHNSKNKTLSYNQTHCNIFY